MDYTRFEQLIFDHRFNYVPKFTEKWGGWQSLAFGGLGKLVLVPLSSDDVSGLAKTRSIDDICRHIGGFFATISPNECSNYFENAGYDSINA